MDFFELFSESLQEDEFEIILGVNFKYFTAISHDAYARVYKKYYINFRRHCAIDIGC